MGDKYIQVMIKSKAEVPIFFCHQYGSRTCIKMKSINYDIHLKIRFLDLESKSVT